NLTYFLRNNDCYTYGAQVFNKYVEITGGEINKETTEYINLNKMNNEPYKGLFYIFLQDPKSYSTRSKLVRCTDIGLIAKTSGKDLQVKAVSIMNQQPLSGITVKLVSYSNQVIKEYLTDDNGKVTFKNWRENIYDFAPYLVLAEKGDDFSYLTFSGTALNKYRFDTGGEPSSSENMKAFLTSDRGLYRPGDKVNLTAIVRNRDITTPPAFIIQCVINGPGGERVYDKKQDTDVNGMSVFSVDMPGYAKTGEYNARLIVNDKDEIGSTTFKVEEFIPDKLVVGIKTGKSAVMPGSDLIFTVKANQMFGPPAAGNRLKTEVEFVNYLFQSKNYKDYIFNDPGREYTTKYERLGDSNLNDIGEKQYIVKVPSQVKPPSALLAQIYSEVYDDGGRPVGVYSSIPVHLYNYYLGVKLHDPKKIYKKGDRVDVDIVAVNPVDEPQK
ncbi:MAG TPA: MG2 domain-containing protein, partial [Candidatus Goldiibacteriota bacterium]|nr:MG2 domain-containing protein [Candidatus Goldiibacteriota bacterium]